MELYTKQQMIDFALANLKKLAGIELNEEHPDPMSALAVFPEEELNVVKIRSKAEKWDELSDRIGKFYETYDDDGNEIEAEEEGDLMDIGEVAATLTGYL